MNIVPFIPAYQSQVDHLLDQCFGPARSRRTASLLRAGVEMRPDLSFVALGGNKVVGSVQLWPMELASPLGIHKLLLLGPLVSAPTRRGEGIGLALMDRALEAADAAQEDAIVLIGDAPYYRRWGFTSAKTLHWGVPGPVDRARLLLRGGDELPLFGRLQPVGGRVAKAA